MSIAKFDPQLFSLTRSCWITQIPSGSFRCSLRPFTERLTNFMGNDNDKEAGCHSAYPVQVQPSFSHLMLFLSASGQEQTFSVFQASAKRDKGLGSQAKMPPQNGGRVALRPRPKPDKADYPLASGRHLSHERRGLFDNRFFGRLQIVPSACCDPKTHAVEWSFRLPS